MKLRSIVMLISCLLAASLIAGCGPFEVGIDYKPATASVAATEGVVATPIIPTQPSATAVQSTAVLPTDTSLPPAATATAIPQLPTATSPDPTDVGATPAQTTVLIYLIAIGDNGQSGQVVGCGDSAVGVQVPIQATPGVLKAAFQALLAIKDREYGQSGLYNALYQSNLTLDSAKVDNGLATIQLSGSLLLGGECDNPRVKAQLEQTALQFSTVQSVAIFINGKPLDQALSLK